MKILGINMKSNNWYKIAQYSQSLVKEIEQIIKNLNLNCSIEEFKDNVYWEYISKYQKLSEEFIREFKDKVSWFNISHYQKLSEEFIREFKDYVDWDFISESQKLSEEFIREFKDKVNWYCISVYQKLSEEFIREFKDKVDWLYISRNQTLSEEFKMEFLKELGLKEVVPEYYRATQEEIYQHFGKLESKSNNWYKIAQEITLKNKMMDHLKSFYNFESDDGLEDDAEIAIYWFANSYHEGQASELYSILSTSPFKPGPISSLENEDDMVKDMYGELVRKFTSESLYLEYLKDKAIKMCEWRNHEMGEWFDSMGESTSISKCIHCQKYVQVIVNAKPNEVDIGGDAVDMDCVKKEKLQEPSEPEIPMATPEELYKHFGKPEGKSNNWYKMAETINQYKSILNLKSKMKLYLMQNFALEDVSPLTLHICSEKAIYYFAKFCDQGPGSELYDIHKASQYGTPNGKLDNEDPLVKNMADALYQRFTEAELNKKEFSNMLGNANEVPQATPEELYTHFGKE